MFYLVIGRKKLTAYLDSGCTVSPFYHLLLQMLSLAALDMILAEDYQQVWIAHLTSKGYTQHIVDSLIADDEQLQALLMPQPEPLKALYIFQSKIVRICFLQLFT